MNTALLWVLGKIAVVIASVVFIAFLGWQLWKLGAPTVDGQGEE